MKKPDIVLFVCLMFTAFTLFVIDITRYQGEKSVLVSVDGKKTVYPFKKNKYVIKSSHGTNILIIDEDGVRIKEASCPDKLCVKQGKIKRAGEVLVCIPNRLVVRIINDEGLDFVTG